MPDTTPDPAAPAAAPGDPIRYVVQQLTERAAQAADMDLGGLAIALGAIANDVDAEIGRLCAENRKLDRDLDEVIGERDHLHEVADKLAYAIAPVEAIGEHSSDNDPWDNAYEELFNQRASRDAAVRAAAIREAADALDAQSCTCGCRRAVEFLLTLADTAAAPTATATPEEH